MNLSQQQWLVVGGAVALVLTTSGLAMHFKGRADHFQRQYAAAALETETLKDQINRPRPLPSTPTVRTVIVDREPVADVATLDDSERLARIRNLEAQLAEKDEMIAAMRLSQRHTPSEPNANPEQAEPRERRDWMEEMRENDPERYEEMVRRREEMRQRVQEGFARRAAHFLNRDTSVMSTEERAEYESMLGLLGETWQLAERVQVEGLSREERSNLRRNIGQNMQALRPLLENERDREFYDLGRQLGYDDLAAAQFVDYLNEMIDLTSLMPYGRRSGFGGGRGGGGPGPGPQ